MCHGTAVVFTRLCIGSVCRLRLEPRHRMIVLRRLGLRAASRCVSGGQKIRNAAGGEHPLTSLGPAIDSERRPHSIRESQVECRISVSASMLQLVRVDVGARAYPSGLCSTIRSPWAWFRSPKTRSWTFERTRCGPPATARRRRRRATWLSPEHA